MSLLKTYLFSRNLGTLLSLALLAGCMQPPGITGQVGYETPRKEQAGTVAATRPPGTEGLPLLSGSPDWQRVQAEAEAPSSKGDGSDATAFWQSGIASWYANRFQGHRTASGERYDLHALTAAHRTLPLGSYVRVTAVTSARSVVVRINDRGPYTRGRVIDLSYAAAAALDLPRAGTLLVRIESVTRQEAGA
jgi:rare lipoprotein A